MSATTFTLPATARGVLISTNPKAGARSGQPAVERLSRLLTDRDYDVEIVTDLKELASRAAAAKERGTLRTVVAAGGDGTAATVANLTEPGVPITLLPLGTENLLAKHLGLAGDPESVCRTICGGQATRLDAGSAGGRLFLIMVSCGFDAEVVRRLHASRRGNIHHLSYAKPIWDSIRSYQYPELRVYCELQQGGEPVRAPGMEVEPIRARWVFVANLPRYAMGLRMVADASGTDGLLDVCTFQRGSLWHGLRYLGGVVFGRHRSWKECVIRRTRRIRIAADEPVPYQLDGDPGGQLPVEIDVLPGRLTLVVPGSEL